MFFAKSVFFVKIENRYKSNNEFDNLMKISKISLSTL